MLKMSTAKRDEAVLSITGIRSVGVAFHLDRICALLKQQGGKDTTWMVQFLLFRKSELVPSAISRQGMIAFKFVILFLKAAIARQASANKGAC